MGQTVESGHQENDCDQDTVIAEASKDVQDREVC